MLRHSFLLAFRSFLRFKSTFFINLIGLSAGLACAILIYLWVNDELHVDGFHAKGERLYRIMTNAPSPQGINTTEGTGGGLGETLAKEMPEVEFATVTTPAAWFQKFTVSTPGYDVSARGQFAGKDFFNVFSFHLLQGREDQVLADKNSVVISEALAKSLFDTPTAALGKTIEWKWLNLKRTCTVTGVFEGTPANSTQQFDFVVSFEVWKEIVPPAADVRGGPFLTFVVLKEGASTTVFQNKLSAFLKQKDNAANATLLATRYADNYLYGTYAEGKSTGGRIAYVKLFSLIAVLIVVMTCINFMNLSTAKASRRIKEVGIKKVVGAQRKTLVLQYLGEATGMAFLSLVVAVAVVQLLLPAFNSITGKQLALMASPALIASLLGMVLVTGIVAGSYPALYLSGLHPALVLKGKFTSSFAELWTRKGLVAFQFALSVTFIVSMMVISNQIDFIQNTRLGYEHDNVLYFEMEGAVAEHPEAFLAEMRNIAGVVHASSIQQNIQLETFFPAPGLRWEGKNTDDQLRFGQLPVNHDLIETLGITMAEGRSFSPDHPSDTAAIIFNKTAIQQMGLKDPVGKTVEVWGKPMTIVGVTEDFHFQSFREPVKPFFFRLSPSETMLVMLRLQGDNLPGTLARIEQAYKTLNPGFTWEYTFLNDSFQRLYVAEKNVSALSRYFAGLAILISCLGLFGLAAFTAERRRKEIGIRKVLGSSTRSIVLLLSADFTKIVLVSIVVALPLSYVVLQQWLQQYAYRIALSPWYFVAAGVVTFVLAMLVVGTQTLGAANLNPVKNLRSE
ncbi:ABC transporter permease [Chryseolinea lacunae]|uniref:ABC transporter permease n=1 Tax=Chryseolinea lacunae TaxID=2801331 RepID=A0ABS1KZC4_9BACT|nr:ABC transporter permease [Chryseolinea lacunae]MBL0744623.1 ABC transporter permease [Chryseolinea lacunae]